VVDRERDGQHGQRSGLMRRGERGPAPPSRKPACNPPGIRPALRRNKNCLQKVWF